MCEASGLAILEPQSVLHRRVHTVSLGVLSLGVLNWPNIVAVLWAWQAKQTGHITRVLREGEGRGW